MVFEPFVVRMMNFPSVYKDDGATFVARDDEAVTAELFCLFCHRRALVVLALYLTAGLKLIENYIGIQQS